MTLTIEPLETCRDKYVYQNKERTWGVGVYRYKLGFESDKECVEIWTMNSEQKSMMKLELGEGYREG